MLETPIKAAVFEGDTLWNFFLKDWTAKKIENILKNFE
jgi:hypothetical protein